MSLAARTVGRRRLMVVAASATALVLLLGVADMAAANLLARAAPIGRFRSAGTFASFCGVASIEVPHARTPRIVTGRTVWVELGPRTPATHSERHEPAPFSLDTGVR